jgi:ATP-dependent Clp protease ATP-binding subunit ClpA
MLSKNLEATLHRSLTVAKEYKHEYATFEHLLFALLSDKDAKKVLDNCGADLGKLSDRLKEFLKDELTALVMEDVLEVKPTAGFQRIIHRSAMHAQAKGHSQINGSHILAEFFFEPEAYATLFLKEQKLTRMDVVAVLSQEEEEYSATPGEDSSKYIWQGEEDKNKKLLSARISETNLTPETRTNENTEYKTLNDYCINLNEKAKNKEFDALVGREEEVERCIEILLRRHKSNPLLVGEPGVGKTAIGEGLASKIVKGEVPNFLKEKVIFALDIGSLVAGTRYRGDFEERVKSLLQELNQFGDGIIFIDEIHTLIGAGSTNGSSLDASNLLKPALARGEINCIGSTTFKEYQTHFEKDAALVRRFQKIIVSEPSFDSTIKILEGLRSYYEKHHGVRYSNEALQAAVKLSERYLNDRRLPDKAIDLLDEAGARKKINKDNQTENAQIEAEDIEKIVAKISKIPSVSVAMNDVEKLQNLDSKLNKRIFGQQEAIAKLCSDIKLSKAGLKDSQKPTGAYLFAGPTGVGKTELAKQLANLSNMNLLRFDMSEYAEKQSVSRLIGTPPGYVGYEEGGILTDSITKYPYSVVLFDEIEKAHSDIYNLLLQIMDYGKITENTGKTINFAHTIIIMTTNAGAFEMDKNSIGFYDSEPEPETQEEVNKIFSPEFRNRLNAVIKFNHLNEEIINQIVDKLIQQTSEYLADQRIQIKVDENAKKYIANKGADLKNGARQIERIIEKEIKQPIADEILFGKLQQGGKVHVSYKNKEGLKFKFITNNKNANSKARSKTSK